MARRRFISGLCTRTFLMVEVAAALYRGLALPYCICVYAEVSLTSWEVRSICSFNMCVCICGDAEVSYRNWGDGYVN